MFDTPYEVEDRSMLCEDSQCQHSGWHVGVISVDFCCLAVMWERFLFAEHEKCL